MTEEPAAAPARRPPNRITVKDRIAIYELLQTVCRVGDDKVASYDDGWSDRAIAEKLGGKIMVAHVQYVRREMFGDLRRQAADPLQEIRDRLSKLETLVAAMVAREVKRDEPLSLFPG